MALKKEVYYDKIEVVGEYKAVHLRRATVIKEGGKELSRSYHRHVIHPDDDISDEPQEVRDICNVIWTDAILSKWTKYQASLD